MKKTILVWAICCALWTFPLSAQQETKEQQETLFHTPIENGAFGGPLLNIAFLNGKATMFTGAWGAWLINHQVALGGGFYNLISPYKVTTDVEMDVEYSVFTAEYVFLPESIAHYTVQLSIGGGSLDFSRTGIASAFNNTIVEDVFWVLEPGLNAEFNILSFMRFQTGIRYRIIGGVNNNSFGITNADISGAGIHCMLKFGKF